MNVFKMFSLCFYKALKSKQISKNNIYNYVIDPFLTAVIFCLMNQKQDIRMVVIGISIMAFWSINIFECSYLVIDERAYGTLGSILISPFRTQFLLFSEIFTVMLLNIPVIIAVFLGGYCIQPYSLFIEKWWLFLLAYFLCILSISSIGLMIAVFLLFVRSARGIMNIIEYPFYLLSGILVPTEQLSVPFQWISKCLPTTYAFRMFQMAFDKNTVGVGENLFRCLLGIVMFHFFIAIIIKFTERQALIKGTMELY